MTAAETSPEPPPGPADDGPVQRRTHRNVLLISLAIVAASLLLRVTDDRQGLALGSPGANRLPGMCLTRAIARIDCPGCGITRSFVAAAHGDLASAFALHRLGPALFLLVLVQIPLRAYALARRIDRPLGLESVLGGRVLGGAIVVALFANWGANLATGAAFH